jgi:ABC-type glycerol-3-phosphate transport system permease component
MSNTSFRDWIDTVKETETREMVTGLSVNTIVAIGAVIFMFPFFYMVITSSLPTSAVYDWPPRLLPGSLFAENVMHVLTETRFPRTMANSLIYAVFGTLGVLITGTTAGYAFAKYSFPGKEPLFYLALITFAVPFQLLAIPLFELLVQFNLVDTYIGVILPVVINPIGVFFMRQNIEQTILDDMLNSARLDGATEIQIFYKIVLPLLKPGLAALAILMFLLKMNTLFWPLVVLRSPEKHVMTVFLAQIKGGAFEPTNWSVVMPSALMATLPILLIFIFLQKYFVKGLLAGSLKE